MANRNKATHQGHCQACNAIQKLPEGVLAKHGYVVAGYGFFNGVCMGSGHKPLEQDKSIVERSIVWAQGLIDTTRAKISDVQAEHGIHFAWFHVYKPATWSRRQSGYKWEYVPVALVGTKYVNRDEYYREGFAYSSEGVEPMQRHSIQVKSTQELCDSLNARYIASLYQDIEQMERYIKNQQWRIQTWHAQPLIPLEVK
jgi:hypothetical protein